MSIRLEAKDLVSTQHMEIKVHGPDGATHLILCTGVADLGSINREIYTFLVGPHLSRRQFVGAIASGAISTIQSSNKNAIEANLVLISADYDDESKQVMVKAEVSSGILSTKLAISYNVHILAEMPIL